MDMTFWPNKNQIQDGIVPVSLIPQDPTFIDEQIESSLEMEDY